MSPGSLHRTDAAGSVEWRPGVGVLVTESALSEAKRVHGVRFPRRSARTVVGVQCPRCGLDDDKVIDSRSVDDGRAIRRRRSCLGCSHRFTTFERIEVSDLVVVKRSGDRVGFDADRIIAGVRAACKNRPVAEPDMEAVAVTLEEALRAEGLGVVTTERIGIEVLDRLRELDQVAYLRFASVYKEFADAADFAREARLLTKATRPKSHESSRETSAEAPRPAT